MKNLALLIHLGLILLQHAFIVAGPIKLVRSNIEVLHHSSHNSFLLS